MSALRPCSMPPTWQRTPLEVNADPLEKSIEKKVCDHAKELGCVVYKFTSPAKRSVPDRLFILPDHKGCFFIEFKRKGCKPTEAQKIEIAKIRGQGMRVFVIDDVTTGRACVADMWHGVACESVENGYAGCDSLEKADCAYCGPYAKLPLGDGKAQKLSQAAPKKEKHCGGAYASSLGPILSTTTMEDPAFN